MSKKLSRQAGFYDVHNFWLGGTPDSEDWHETNYLSDFGDSLNITGTICPIRLFKLSKEVY